MSGTIQNNPHQTCYLENIHPKNIYINNGETHILIKTTVLQTICKRQKYFLCTFTKIEFGSWANN